MPINKTKGNTCFGEEIEELVQEGWTIGAHTHTHPDLSNLAIKDPTGDLIQQELERCDSILEHRLSIKPRYFAFTGTSWSSVAETEVKKRYKLGRLWIIDSHYQADGETIRYADLIGQTGPDEIDGGPPMPSRYINRNTKPFMIPSMEIEGLIYEYDDFIRYLTEA